MTGQIDLIALVRVRNHDDVADGGGRPAQQGPRRAPRPRPTSRSAPTPGTTSSPRSPSVSTDLLCQHSSHLSDRRAGGHPCWRDDKERGPVRAPVVPRSPRRDPSGLDCTGGRSAYHEHHPWYAGAAGRLGLFFALSGYLITGLSIDELESRGSVRVSHFYAPVRASHPRSLARCPLGGASSRSASVRVLRAGRGAVALLRQTDAKSLRGGDHLTSRSDTPGRWRSRSTSTSPGGLLRSTFARQRIGLRGL